jgi:hypothetical protein
MLGLSGRLRAVMGTRDALEENPILQPLLAGSPPETAAAGPWPKLSTPDGDPFTVVPLVPMAEAGKAGLGNYRVGRWPSGGTKSTLARYAPPSGVIDVTPENQGTNVSVSFTMRDFLTHDQGAVWPKALVLRPALLDKL